MLYAKLVKDLKLYKEEIETLILQGKLEDFNDYHYLIGKLKGISNALDITKEIFKRGEDD